MWTCQTCGTAYDDAEGVCAPCARTNESEVFAAPPARQVRGLGFLLGAVIVSVALGLLVGAMLDSQKTPRLESEEVELHVGKSTGAFVGAVIGVLIWATFPYRATPRSQREPQDSDSAPSESELPEGS